MTAVILLSACSMRAESEPKELDRKNFLFNKNQECQKYKPEIQENLALSDRQKSLESYHEVTSIFYNEDKNTCLYVVEWKLWQGENLEYNITLGIEVFDYFSTKKIDSIGEGMSLDESDISDFYDKINIEYRSQ